MCTGQLSGAQTAAPVPYTSTRKWQRNSTMKQRQKFVRQNSGNAVTTPLQLEETGWSPPGGQRHEQLQLSTLLKSQGRKNS